MLFKIMYKKEEIGKFKKFSNVLFVEEATKWIGKAQI